VGKLVETMVFENIFEQGIASPSMKQHTASVVARNKVNAAL